MPKLFVLKTMIHWGGGDENIALQLKIQSYSNDITWNTLDEDQSWSFLQSWVPRIMIFLLPIILVQCHLYSDFFRSPGVEMSAVFLLRAHGHARHGHGVHVHLSHGTTAAIHVHHIICCRIPLVGKLLLGEGAVPGQVS